MERANREAGTKGNGRCQIADGREVMILRLVTGVLIEISETWETGKTYLTPS